MLILFHALLTLFLPLGVFAQTECNGRADYCDRRYSELSFVGAHNSPFVGFLPQHNQEISVVSQLNLGVRYLQGQTHLNARGKLRMCHTSCFLENAGGLDTFLRKVKGWLDDNPDEVVTLLITNGDRLDISRFDESFRNSGIVPYAFVPSSSPHKLPLDEWPTLQQMIQSDKRLVVFLDYGADMRRVPYILDEFSYYWETPFDTTDPLFLQCKIDRPPNANPDDRMYIVNHYLDIEKVGVLFPDRLSAPRTNAPTGKGSIGAQVELCTSIHGHKPNVVLVDFLNQGDVLRAQDMMNIV
ncbi:hypothetical protein RJZ56_006806 [Blastomyces dermatitidis]|uniref:PLC-like phosphodiesterase n=3 Tax=Blastomyces TaxID=229219 RepID=A0A179V1M1_BLAGS|nr:uncharacterized protein BDBG_09040 [Blastomyces gilchristii SLH14081]XP_045273925.1 uncharacterized protein BDCG_01479 [Blastomyces dermatitidis ER-3]EGE84372.1 hypothetical protein BDDG_07317 [Blastomyces dermatitidis ATCC 18188]EQL28514.1 hypothetical protein BDFG_08751 [Blastomyces dermatitidis ATCC 26199]EEQ86359.1 hypothetical protein BDCG_01479 [Blastomyces dermatitidis ER-3]OAT13933.1 hypothetical protein BDBG_09040 [Blastomyces gilchristii SLH14081]